MPHTRRCLGQRRTACTRCKGCRTLPQHRRPHQEHTARIRGSRSKAALGGAHTASAYTPHESPSIRRKREKTRTSQFISEVMSLTSTADACACVTARTAASSARIMETVFIVGGGRAVCRWGRGDEKCVLRENEFCRQVYYFARGLISIHTHGQGR
jgi:hypothetical protein